jgi:hypothetical protein
MHDSSADAVSVPSKLLNHAQTEDRTCMPFLCHESRSTVRFRSGNPGAVNAILSFVRRRFDTVAVRQWANVGCSPAASPV